MRGVPSWWVLAAFVLGAILGGVVVRALWEVKEPPVAQVPAQPLPGVPAVPGMQLMPQPQPQATPTPPRKPAEPPKPGQIGTWRPY
ncbi:MAG: hypothetical protein K2Q10_13225 [Rhodospirillales bacterium]|nr:hypothetical protein [Rhodospirillales bacterium]